MDTLKQVKDTVLDTAKGAGQAVTNVTDTVIDTAKEAVVNAKDAVFDTAREAGQAVVNAKDTVVDTAKGAGQAVANLAKDAGDRVMEAKERVLEMADVVFDKIRGVAGQEGALKLLKEDHELVSSLFEQLDSVEAGPASDEIREGLFAQLKYELETHASLEERLFYPALQDANPDLMEEAFAEHAEVKRILSELSASKISERWMDKLRTLKDKVEHHVREEETEVFTLAYEVLNSDDLDALGKQMEMEKKAMAEETSVRSSRKTSRKTGKKTSHARTGSWAAEHRAHH
jgi:hemerythrin superfamily protein